LVLLLYFPLARADGICSDGSTPCVAAGTDYLMTFPGTQFNGIPLTGYPIVGAPGGADTIIQRTSDTVINGGFQSNLQITGLSLANVADDIFITLDPADLALDTGTINVMGSLAGGTFDSTLNVYFDVCMGGDSGTGVGCGAFPFYDGGVLNGSTVLSQNGAEWTSVPAGPLVIGPYSNGVNPYNEHTGLPSNVVDFFPGDPGIVTLPNGQTWNVRSFQESSAGFSETHVVGELLDPVPEPTSMILLGTGLLGLAGWKKKNFPRKKS
jgi:hypothetical protein